MKILAVGDPHCKVGTIGEVLRLQDEILRHVSDHDVDMCVVLGDLHDTFEKAHVLAFNTIVDFLKIISTRVPTVYVVGNHDMVNNSGFLHENHFFKAMKLWDKTKYNLTVIDSPTMIEGFLFCPYVPAGQMMDAVGSVPGWMKAKAVFCHQEFIGAKMGAIISKHGDEWPKDYPLAVSGHIHTYDRLADNILYVGSPYMTGYGDTGTKTVSLLAFSDDDWREERLSVDVPKKVTMHISLDDVADVEIPQDGSTVRIKIEGTAAALSAFKKTAKFKDMSEKAKVICTPTDSTEISSGLQRQSYVGLLRKACEQESDMVKDLFEKINNTSVDVSSKKSSVKT
ncbi:endonuclease subunit [uncultured Caudovirales phage]|uniref:Endonuclease subunit n=1 Tax=uncultured Caudovirales phage TaxID=2100421 RepID=A0A6J7WSL5_9CAUD|nr:endonuclease subunit [uncultured Caudovirales phage]